MTLIDVPKQGLFLGGQEPGHDTEQEAFTFDADQWAFIDEGVRLDREGMLALAFSPRDLVRGRRVTETIVKVGRKEESALAPSSSFVAPQIRQEYSPSHALYLGRDIREDKIVGQINPCQVGLHDEASAATYLTDLNEHFNSNITMDDLIWHKKFGGFLITIAGHNRQLGVAMANIESFGHHDHGIAFEARVFRNPLFYKALSVQARENTGQNPNTWERSRSMWSIRQQGIKYGDVVTDEQNAKIHGTSVSRVKESLRFEMLPDRIKQLAIEGSLPFDGAFELDRLIGLYYEGDVIELAEKFAAAELSGKQIKEQVRLREVVRNLSADIRLKVDAGLIPYAHAVILDEMYTYGIANEIIEELATKIAIEKYSLVKSREFADDRKKERRDGTRSLLANDEGLDPVERKEHDQKIRTRVEKTAITNLSRDIQLRIAGLMTSANLGTLVHVIDDKPVSSELSPVLTDSIEQFIELLRREGREDAASQLEKYQKALADIHKAESQTKELTLPL